MILPPTLVVTRWFQIALAHRLRRRAHAHLGAHRAHRRVARRHGRDPVVQPRGRVPERSSTSSTARTSARTQHAQNLSSLFFPAIEFLGVIATVAVLALGARLHEDGTLTLGTLIAFIGLLALVFQPLQELSELYGQVQSAAAAMEKITTVLDDRDRHRARPARCAAHRARRGARRRSTTSTFAYGRDPVLHGIDLAHPGRRLRRARRHVGRRQVDARASSSGASTTPRGRRARRRQRPARGRPRALPPPARRRAAGPVPVRRHDRRQPALRRARRDRRDVEETARAIGLDRVARRLLRRARARGARGRLRPLGRRAAADLDRAARCSPIRAS